MKTIAIDMGGQNMDRDRTDIRKMRTITMREVSFFEWQKDDLSACIMARGGSYGGGSEVLIITDQPAGLSAMTITKGLTDNRASGGSYGGGQRSAYNNRPACGAVCYDDYKGPNRQYVEQGKLILEDDMYNKVRRLTPKECERLQGFPDDWTNIGEWIDSNGKVHKDADSPRYKALGNSIALPQWRWVIGRMMKHLPEQPTMASLFDGIGGFPLIFQELGGRAIWASEIEEFPIAVTKKHFPED